ncbi:TlpA family protein disulfide reductase [Shewanella zhangzhouensis]|uniref:TlpA family protein disulfide reductase n=1 Tax=Shewanella zhangzhouensis TaxID=2864213 RepID=UPI001C658B1D|nr:redoxin domain-containing protein [Shewanella zhangzhouensis]QYK04371.1 redoxin domain-containing protein [Shewanella zhangzhouensis]
MTSLPLNTSKLLPKLMSVGLSALLLSAALVGQASAKDDFAAEGERRAKLAGSELLGTPAPGLSLTTLTGDTLNLGELYGKKPVYLKFWATWCVPCRQQMPGFEKIYQQYGNDLQVIAVNTGISDNLNSVGAFVKKTGLNMPVTIDDGTLARAFNLRVTPQHFLIDRDGRIAYVGHQDDEAFHQALKAVVAAPGARAATVAGADGVAPKTAETALVNVAGYGLGDILVPLTLTDLDNHAYPLPTAVKPGKATGLVFFAPWCEWYLAESEPATARACQQVREMIEQQAPESNAQWLHISSNLWSSEADLAEYQTNYKPQLPIVFDEQGSLFGQFGVTQLPTIVYIDEAGKVTEKVSLQAPDFIPRLQSLLGADISQ